MLLVLGVSLLAVVSVAYLLGYGARSHPPAATPADSSPSSPSGFTFASAGLVGVSSYSSSITWTTSEPSTGILQWGPVGVEPMLWDTVRRFDTRHVVRLRGLAPSTTYHATILASSIERKTARTDLSFTTSPAPSQAQGRIQGGVLLVNGEPFFPLLSWQQCPDQWQASLDAGINLFAIGGPCANLSSTLPV